MKRSTREREHSRDRTRIRCANARRFQGGPYPDRPHQGAGYPRARPPQPPRLGRARPGPAAPRPRGGLGRPPALRARGRGRKEGRGGRGEQVKNANVVHYDLWQIVTDSFAVSQAIHPPSPKPSPPLPAHAPPCADPDGPGRPEGRVDTARGGHDRRQRQGAAGRRRPEPVPPRPPSPSFALPSCLLSSP